jgi:WD40 repeat protein
LSNGPTILELPLHIGDVSALGFSASSRWLGTGGTDGMVKLWDLTNRTLMYSLKGHLGRVNSVRFASDERTVASASEDGTTRVWNLPPNRSPRVFGLHDQSIFSVAYSPDGKYLAVGTGNPSVLPAENDIISDSSGGFVHIWEITSGELVRTFRADDWRVLVLAFTTMGPDRSRLRLITGGYDSQLKVWDALTEGEPLILKGTIVSQLKVSDWGISSFSQR